MASESDAHALFQRLMTMPLFAAFTTTRSESTPVQNSEDPDTESPNPPSPDRIILINPLTQGMVVIGGGASGFDSLFDDLGKGGQPPASKASIESMPSFEIKCEDEVERLGSGECVICLEEWRIGDVVNEMPCKHKFHGGCVEKWLKIHGSCPVCRYKMPVDDSDRKKTEDENGRRRRREVWVTFAFANGRSGIESESSNEDSSDS